LQLYFANISSWSRKAAKFVEEGLQAQEADSVLFVEHKCFGQQATLMRKAFRRAGFFTTVDQAEVTEKDGRSGGALVALKSFRDSSSPARPDRVSRPGAWAGRLLRSCGVHLLLVALYLRPADDACSEVVVRELATFLAVFKVPFLIAADWNKEPHDEDILRWSSVLGARAVAPSNSLWTCCQGQRRLLDFVLVSPCLLPSLHVLADEASPWSPHKALRITLDLDFDNHWVYQQVKPKSILAAAGPALSWDTYQRRARGLQHPFVVSYPVGSYATSWGLSWRFLHFVAATEERGLDLASVPEEQRHKFRGRGSPPTFQWTRSVAPVRPGAVFRDPGLCFWGSLRFQLRQTVLPGAGRCEAEASCLTRRLAEQALQVHQQWPQGRPLVCGSSALEFAGQLCSWQELGPRERAVQLRVAKGVEEALLADHFKESGRSFAKWLAASFENGGRAAHAWAKQQVGEEAFAEQPHHEDVQEVALDWQQLWSEAEVRDGFLACPPWLHRLRAKAKAQHGQQEPIQLSSLRAALARAPPQAGMSFDRTRVAHWKNLDPEGQLELLGLLRSVEDELAWPAQQLLLQMAKLGKPGGGHRLIALTGSLYRLWSSQSRGLAVGRPGEAGRLLGCGGLRVQLPACCFGPGHPRRGLWSAGGLPGTDPLGY